MVSQNNRYANCYRGVVNEIRINFWILTIWWWGGGGGGRGGPGCVIITCVTTPFSSRTCWTICPGGKCKGNGYVGPFSEIILTVAGPEKSMKNFGCGVCVYMRVLFFFVVFIVLVESEIKMWSGRYILRNRSNTQYARIEERLEEGKKKICQIFSFLLLSFFSSCSRWRSLRKGQRHYTV